MSVISGNDYTYTGTVLNNSIGYLIQRTPTTTSSDTLPTAAELILAYVGVQDASNNGLSLTITIYNNSAFTITMNPNTGLTFINSATDTIYPQAVRTYTFIQTSATTIVTYIVGAAPVVVSQTNTGIALTSGSILVGNSSNIASGVSMTGDSTITNAGVLAVNRIAGAVLGTTTATSGNLLVGSGTAWATTAMTGDATMVSSGSLTVNRINLANDIANANDFLVFSNVATGSQPLKTTSNCRYNPDLTTGGIFILNSPAATSSSTGAMINSGGEGIAKNVWIGSNFTAANTTTAGSVINVPSFTYTSSTSNPTNVNIDTLNQITLNGTGTATNAASLYIAGPPIAGTLAITNPYSLQVVSGNSIFGGNVSANNHIQGYATTTTAAGTTTLTVASPFQQYFTGTTNQSVTMPVASTLVLGQTWNIVNNSTGIVTINSSGSNIIIGLAANTSALITCILVSGTTAASWTVKRIETQPRLTYLTSGTTYTTPAFINTDTIFKITLVGAGGGGSGAGGADRGTGGGGGAVGVFQVSGLSPNTGYTIGLGVAGTGGTAGTLASSNGTIGGNTTFNTGTLYQASGGNPGLGNGGTAGTGGTGGTTSGGTFLLSIQGGQGGGGNTTTGVSNSGEGGSSGLGYGIGGAGRMNTGVGLVGTGYGAGGSGGYNNSGGGAGTGGLIVIEYVA